MLCPTTQSQVWFADAIQMLDPQGSGSEPLLKNQNENEQNTLNWTIVWTGSPKFNPFDNRTHFIQLNTHWIWILPINANPVIRVLPVLGEGF